MSGFKGGSGYGMTLRAWTSLSTYTSFHVPNIQVSTVHGIRQAARRMTRA